ncbi:MAG: TonB-dependent receptor [Prevotella sp.]|nr:TonB-dependent receptor [Prevotella sp.]
MMKQVKFTLPLRMLALICGLILSASAFAQQITVNGHVKDTTGEPIIGATIRVVNETGMAVTDFDGNFTIKAQQGAQLSVSYIGYTDALVTAAPNVVVIMQDDAQLMDEVVVIGYGTMKKSDLTGSVVQVKADEFNRGAITSPQEMLQGKVAGVFVQPSSGAPGGGATMRIRSGASLNASNDPLIVIDGVPVSNDAAPGMSNALSSINPADIESFSILKDASATAIYGSRASNGVIIITTKKGSKGLKVSYSGTISVQDPYKKLEVLSAKELVPNMLKSYEGTAAGANLMSIFSENGTITQDADGNYIYEGVDTDWQDEIFHPAVQHDHNVSVNGQVGAVPFRASVGYSWEDGTLKESNFERYTGSLSLTPKLFDDHLSITLNGKGTVANNRYGAEGAIGAAAYYDPTKPVRNDGVAAQAGRFNGWYNWIQANGNFNSLAPVNPLSQIYDYSNDGTTKRFIGNAQFDYKMHFLPELRANLNVGLDISEGSGNTKTALNSFQAVKEDIFPGTSTNSDWKNFRRNSLLDFYLNYNNDIKALASHIDLTAGYSWQRFYGANENTTRSNLTATEMGMTSAVGYTLNPSDDHFYRDGQYRQPWENYLVSFFGRLNYNLMDKYLLTATLRRDGSSRFSKDNRWGLFPAAALAWTIKNEGFLKDVRAIDNLRLRLGYGVTGQQDIGDCYAYIPSYIISSNPNSTYLGNFLIKPGGYNPDLRWEQTTTYNVALDYAFANSRINGSIDFYIKKTKDLLNTVSSPAGTNFTNLITGNIGQMENKGVEFALNTVPIETKNLHWDLNFNFTWNTSEITKLTAAYNPDYPGIDEGGVSFGTNTYAQKHNVGYAPFTYYLYQQVYDTDGNPIQNTVVDRNNDGQITDADRYMTDKNPAPKFYMGLSSMITFKQFDFGFNLRANFDNYMFNALAAGNSSVHSFWDQGYVNNVMTSALTSGFTHTPELTGQLSDYFLENASFLKCDNITLGYNFTNFTTAKLSGRVSFSVQNVFTVTNYSGLDPETTGNGIDYSMWPRPRTYTLGLNLNF